MSDLITEFNDYRAKMNERLLADDNKVIKRIFNLDTNAYSEGALDVKTKELLKDKPEKLNDLYFLEGSSHEIVQ